MAVRTKIEPLERDIKLLMDQELSPGARSRRLAEFAREKIAEARAINKSVTGTDVKYDVAVDGSKGRPLEQVSPNGVIVAEFYLIQDALAGIGEMLVKGSPVLTGRYQASHVLFADGVAVDPNNLPLDAQEYAFVSTMPYARKIERGLSPQAPEGVYNVVATLANRRWGNLARIRFGFRSVPGGAIGRWSQSSSARALARDVRGGNPAHHGEWLTRQPAVILTTR